MADRTRTFVVVPKDLFTRDGKVYATFTVEGFPHPFLYFTSLDEPLRAVYTGPDMDRRVVAVRDDGKGSCIECQTCIDITGGVSVSGDKIVEVDFDHETARQIVAALKHAMEGRMEPSIVDVVGI